MVILTSTLEKSVKFWKTDSIDSSILSWLLDSWAAWDGLHELAVHVLLLLLFLLPLSLLDVHERVHLFPGLRWSSCHLTLVYLASDHLGRSVDGERQTLKDSFSTVSKPMFVCDEILIGIRKLSPRSTRYAPFYRSQTLLDFSFLHYQQHLHNLPKFAGFCWTVDANLLHSDEILPELAECCVGSQILSGI